MSRCLIQTGSDRHGSQRHENAGAGAAARDVVDLDIRIPQIFFVSQSDFLSNSKNLKQHSLFSNNERPSARRCPPSESNAGRKVEHRDENAKENVSSRFFYNRTNIIYFSVYFSFCMKRHRRSLEDLRKMPAPPWAKRTKKLEVPLARRHISSAKGIQYRCSSNIDMLASRWGFRICPSSCRCEKIETWTEFKTKNDWEKKHRRETNIYRKRNLVTKKQT